MATDSDQQQRTEAAASVNQQRLEAELADSRLLQTISAELINHDDVALHEKILDAAIAIVPLRLRRACRCSSTDPMAVSSR